MRIHDQEPVVTDARATLQRKEEEESGLVAAKALETNQPDTLDAGAVAYLQRTAGNAAVAQLLGAEGEEETESPVGHVVGSANGRPLDDSVRTLMEGHFGGQDFSDVRVHTDSRADDSARSLHAQAYTVGSDIAFRSGNYSPDSQTGQRMLAHELTHVVQQRSGPVDGTPMPGGIKVSDPADRFELEAERSADAFLAGESAPSPAPVAEATAQRQEDDEEEELQGLFVQRAPGGGSGEYGDEEEDWAEG